ncbi:4a-hydroxytetrahydrobiopterin dehydratase [Thiomicrorhabdus sediminis]|uniref:Putative pterin-4-alpha-carbinolamine dehydratase n=1 Tax=Thiomicrorhabdus sediminis TaxID=2580412 RepID=A0A4P9K6S9_9GAMM|nr:4a-hydroxytetrahydrobiopterin dehydratase [Thiomicrorhabdus sediminis]QCU90581.1 4a-hydroxytetrahydrobiopterin dehydratase [Thiomicrorhabdus sediminis]
MSTASPMLEELLSQKCEDIAKGSKPIIIPTIESNLSVLSGWDTPLNYAHIHKTFQFKNYHQTVAFVNAVTWLAHKEDHHPKICFDYNSCEISLSTHNVGGLTMNDMIMAAKINALLED